jgi:glycosyltransferase involved in cell wall biosynthesis
MNEPKISVIVANFNHKPYIEQAVKSIINQTYKNLEIIIVDDCSNDGSREVINELVKLDNRILEPIFLPKNMGKWFALNQGIEKRASGQYITTQDADDASCPQRLEWQYKTMNMMGSYHNLCGFQNCSTQKEMDDAVALVAQASGPTMTDIIPHEQVVELVYKGFKTPGINHYFMGSYETHGASALFYKQLWDHGLKFMPGNLGLRCQVAEDSDMNTKLTLLLQKTSVVKVPFYCYRRGTTTNPAFTEQK